MIGINSAIFSQTGAWNGIGVAIPVNLAKDVLGQLRATGRVVRGYLGVVAAPVSPDLAASRNLDGPRGALVSEVVPGSPAAAAGRRVNVEVARGKDTRTIAVTLAELKDQGRRR